MYLFENFNNKKLRKQVLHTKMSIKTWFLYKQKDGNSLYNKQMLKYFICMYWKEYLKAIKNIYKDYIIIRAFFILYEKSHYNYS